MKLRLSDHLVAQMQASTEPVLELAYRLHISAASVSKYRPTRRHHTKDDEFHQIVTNWISRVPTIQTAERFQIDQHTVYAIRRRAMEELRRDQ